ncbi:hypothetical protein MTO96_046409 [Rhipicephalus appendiculatus]
MTLSQPGTSRTTASRLDRIYVPDLLLPSIVSCEVLVLPDTLAGLSDHAPVVTTDEECVARIKTSLEESLTASPHVTPAAWDELKATWRSLLQQEGRARKKRTTARLNELLRRMRIIQSADALTSCTRDYLDSLRVQHDRLLRESTRVTRAVRTTTGDPPEIDLSEINGNGSQRIAAVRRPDGTLTTDPAEIEATFLDHFKAAFTYTLPRRGALLNEHKSKALLFGPFPTDAIGNIEVVSTVKVLGVFFTCEGVAANTWTRALDRAQQLTERAKLLELTLREKALTIKTSICALASYVSRISIMPTRTATQFNKLITAFLWDGKPPPRQAAPFAARTERGGDLASRMSRPQAKYSRSRPPAHSPKRTTT